jgi:TetR/AcrR family transcriptional regulator
MAKTTPPPTPEARERILRAAELLFARKGYAATSVHEITDAAAVNRALLYYYFEDKHSLYAALIDEGVAEFGRMLDAALSGGGSCAEQLGRFVRGHLELIWTRGPMARLVHRCLLDDHQAEFGLVQKFRVNMDRLETFFREAAASGEFRPLDPEIAARTVLGPIFIFSLERIHDRDRFTPDELAPEITRLLLAGLKAVP